MWKTQSFLLNEIVYAHPFAGLLWEGRFEEVLLGLGREKVPNWKWLFGQRRQRFVLVGVRRWFWNSWKTAEHGSTVEEIDGTCWSWRTTSFLDHVYLGCTQRECNPNEDSVSQHRDEFLLPQLKNYQIGRNLTQKLSCGPATWKAMRKRAWRERYCELANKKTGQLYTVSTLCLDDQNYMKEDLVTVGESSPDGLEMLVLGTHW